MNSVVQSHKFCLTQSHIASRPLWRPHWSLPLVALVSLGGLSGCGPKAPYELVPVSGKVTYSDGSRIDADQIQVTFLPLATSGAHKPNSAIGYVNVADGSFVLTTGSQGDGAAVGKHAIEVMAFKKLKQLFIGAKITPSEFEVVEGDPIFVHVKVEKKS